jgi:uncharacterized NAD-dependent epimerase/dehydratase family protein
MAAMTTVQLRQPYLLLVGDETDATYAKTASGLVQWRRDAVAGQLRFTDAAIDLGVPDLRIEDAVRDGVGSLIIGVAPVGGAVPGAWWQVMTEAAMAGLDVVSGLHTKLADNPDLVAAADAGGARLVDIRVAPQGLPVGTGKQRSGRRVLTVGTDCAVGKKYTALALHAALLAAGLKATFRATGQTGIMIAGEGIPIDAVVADFVSGAAEVLSPANDTDHWDVIEGQGSVFHPAYSGVSLGLLHGSQPDAIVVCHDASRTRVAEWEDFELPTLADAIALNQQLARRTNPKARCIGLSINTSALAGQDRLDYLDGLRQRHGIPAVDPLVDGCDELVTALTDPA